MTSRTRYDRTRRAANSLSESFTSGQTNPAIRTRLTRGPIRIFEIEPDNNGTRLFRSRAAHNAHFDLPRGYSPDQDTGALQCFNLIASFTGTYLSLRRPKNNADPNVWMIEIWGDDQECRNACLQLGDFVASAPTQGSRAKKWSTVRSMLSPWGEGAEKKHLVLQERAKFEKYRRDPPQEELTGLTFKHAYALPWTEETGRIEDLLGNNLEALDNLRMDGLCHIKFTRTCLGANFVLLGNRPDRIEKMVQRLQTIPERTFSYTSGPIVLFLFKPLSRSIERRSLAVRQIDYDQPQFLSPKNQELAQDTAASKMVVFERQEIDEEKQDDVKLTLTSINELAEYDRGAVFVGLQNAAHINSQYLHSWITPVLEQLRFWQGHVAMDVQLSACHFKKYRPKDIYSVSELEESFFDANHGDEDLRVSSAAELGGEYDGAALLRAFMTASGVFLPPTFFKDDMPLAAKLDAAPPCCRAVFVIDQVDGKFLRLEEEHICNSDLEYSLSARRWLRHQDQNVTKEPPFLAINLLDLEHSHLSHSLKIQRTECLRPEQEDRLPQAFTMFRKRLSLRSDAAQRFDEKLFNYLETDACRILYHEQTRFWTFPVKGTGYVAELFLTQMFDYQVAQITSKRPAAWSRQPRWGVRVYHEDWSTILSQNRDVGIGKKAKWIPVEEQFFPSRHMQMSQDLVGQEAIPGAGIRQLLRVLKRVDDVVKSTATATPEETLIDVNDPAPLLQTQPRTHLVHPDQPDLLGDLEDNFEFEMLLPEPPPAKESGRKKAKVPKSRNSRPPTQPGAIVSSFKFQDKDASILAKAKTAKRNPFEALGEEEA